MDVRRFQARDLEGVLRLCVQEAWPSLPQDPQRAARALTAPGVTTVVAELSGEIVGFAQMLSDGEIQAYLALIAVAPGQRRKGLGRRMIVAALALAGGERVDLLTETAEGFYRELPHLRLQGFRLYPDYSGPDRYTPGLTWTAGRKTGKA